MGPNDKDPFEKIRIQKELEKLYPQEEAERDNPNQPGYSTETQEAWEQAQQDINEGDR